MIGTFRMIEADNPWSVQSAYLDVAFPLILNKYDLESMEDRKTVEKMRLVCKEWNRYALAYLNEWGFDRKILEPSRILKRVRVDPPNNELTEWVSTLKKLIDGISVGGYVTFSITFGLLGSVVGKAALGLEEALTEAAYEILKGMEAASDPSSYELLLEGLKRIHPLGSLDGGGVTHCNGTFYNCWNDLFGQPDDQRLENYFVQDLSFKTQLPFEWTRENTFNLVLPVLFLALLGSMESIDLAFQKRLLPRIFEERELRLDLIHLQNQWNTLNASGYPKRHREVHEREFIPWTNEIAQKRKTWTLCCQRILLTTGYTVATCMAMYGLLQGMEEELKENYPAYRELYRPSLLENPLNCTEENSDSFGLVLENCTRYLFDQTELTKLFLEHAPLKLEDYQFHASLLFKIGLGMSSSIFLLHKWVKSKIQVVKLKPEVNLRAAGRAIAEGVSSGWSALRRRCIHHGILEIPQ